MREYQRQILRPILPVLSLVACTGCLTTGEHTSDSDHLPVVYGADDRKDVYDFADPVWRAQAADFTVALVSPWDIDASNPIDVRFPVDNLQSAFNICQDEHFANQLTAAFCSGTLIAPDLVLTAGHCVNSSADCNDTRLVFNYYMDDATTLHTVTGNDIYSCAELVVREYTSTLDYAILRLDRPAMGRALAPVQTTSGALPVDTDLVVNGYPSGLPMKIDDGGAVRDGRVTTQDYFVTNLDTFGGNSGSGVFATGELVGILVRGDTDYVFDSRSGCRRVNICPDDGCSGEEATYAFRAIDDLCATAGSSVLCPCGDGMCDAAGGETTATCAADCGASCGDGACNGPENVNNCPTDCGTCGNGMCDADEDMTLCCTDCGCAATQICTANACVPEPGVGDTCAAPFDVTASGSQLLSGDTSTASDDYTPSCGFSNSPDHVYAFTVSTETLLDARVSGYDTVLSLRSTCSEASSEIACNDDASAPNDGRSRIYTLLAPGMYHVIVDGYQSDAGSYELTMDFLHPSTDPTCAAPAQIVVEPGTQSITDNTLTACNHEHGSCAGNGGEHVYMMNLTETYHVTVELWGYDTALYVRTECAEPASEIACNDDHTPGELGSYIGLADLPPGTYYLIVDGYDSSGAYTLDITFAKECEDGDGDESCDPNDRCPDDSNKVEPGVCGCGVADEDTDGDGAADCSDQCPDDPGKVEPGICGCGVGDEDIDRDGTADCSDQCPADPGKVKPGICGCGVGDEDTDRDGTADCSDQCSDHPRDGALACEEPSPKPQQRGGCSTTVAEHHELSSGTLAFGLLLLLLLGARHRSALARDTLHEKKNGCSGEIRGSELSQGRAGVDRTRARPSA